MDVTSKWGHIINTVSLSNQRTRTCARKIGMLFDMIFRHHNNNNLKRSEFYEYVLALYPQNMITLRKRSNMSSHEIITLQQMIDVWYDKWIGLIGCDRMTNYVHMLGASHVTYYLRKKHNLYRYSN